MNYLAHIYLSGSSPQIRVGGFIADAVKGGIPEHYPYKLRSGIRLHRLIDNYTDDHPLVREMVALLNREFGRYGGILPDLFFDHYLARDFENYSSVSLSSFSRKFYFDLVLNYSYLPVRIRRFMWHFIFTNRLCCYRTVEGLMESVGIMVEYRGVPFDINKLQRYFVDNYDYFQDCFYSFFPDVMNYAENMKQEENSR